MTSSCKTIPSLLFSKQQLVALEFLPQIRLSLLAPARITQTSRLAGEGPRLPNRARKPGRAEVGQFGFGPGQSFLEFGVCQLGVLPSPSGSQARLCHAWQP